MVKGSLGVCAILDVATNSELTNAVANLMEEKSFFTSEPSVGGTPFLSGGIPYTPAGTFVAAARRGIHIGELEEAWQRSGSKKKNAEHHGC